MGGAHHNIRNIKCQSIRKVESHWLSVLRAEGWLSGKQSPGFPKALGLILSTGEKGKDEFPVFQYLEVTLCVVV